MPAMGIPQSYQLTLFPVVCVNCLLLVDILPDQKPGDRQREHQDHKTTPARLHDAIYLPYHGDASRKRMAMQRHRLENGAESPLRRSGLQGAAGLVGPLCGPEAPRTRCGKPDYPIIAS